MDKKILLTTEDLISISRIKTFIHSLQQPKIPVAFECEMEKKIALDGHTIIGVEPKTTPNPDGTNTWVGMYIY